MSGVSESSLAAWLSALSLPLPITFDVGPRVREFGNGDLVGTVTTVAGPGLIREGLWNVEAFQVRIDCRERNQPDAKLTAETIDRALVFGDYPASLWGTWVTSVDRAGSGPVPEQPDEHQRVFYTCTYLVETAP